MSTGVVDQTGSGRRRRRPSGEPPPLPHDLNRTAVGWLTVFTFWAIVWIWVFLSNDAKRWITARDLELMHPIVDHRVGWLTTLMRGISTIAIDWLTPIVAWTTILVAILARRIRHVLLLLASLALVSGIVTVVALEILRPRPLGIEQLADWNGPPQPSRPIALLTTVLMGAGLTLAPRGRWRRRWRTAAISTIVVVGCAQIYLGVEHPSDVPPAATVGVAVTLVLFRLGAPEEVFPIAYRTGKTAHLDVTGARGEAIRRALGDQLGIHDLVDIERIGLAGSAGSTPLRIRRAEGPDLFGKLYASNHLRSDRSYKLGRTLLYGRLEDEQRFTSVRRLVQHEDYMLHVMDRAGIDSMAPLGIVEITPDREYLLVSEFLDGACEIGDADITTELIDSGLAAVARMWEAGVAHRDIKPANVMVHEGRVRLIDLSFAEVRPSPWRQAVDLANMMLVLALGSSPELVYERARLQFGEDDIAEAFAASRGVTLPSALRSDIKRDGRELLVRFRALAPARPVVSIQRWSIRRIGLMLWVVVVTLVVISIFVDLHADIGLR